MPLINIIVILIAAGILMWVVNTYIPLEAGIKKLLNIVVIVALVLWLLKIVGIWAYLATVRI